VAATSAATAWVDS